MDNFQVERDGKAVMIWFDSGADIENCMLAFTHECASEIEAQLIAQNVENLFGENSEGWFESGREYERKRALRDIGRSNDG